MARSAVVWADPGVPLDTILNSGYKPAELDWEESYKSYLNHILYPRQNQTHPSKSHSQPVDSFVVFVTNHKNTIQDSTEAVASCVVAWTSMTGNAEGHMNRAIYIATVLAFVFLTAAGCQTTSLFRGLARKDRDKPSTFARDKSPSKSGERSSGIVASNSTAPMSPEQAITTGQQEIAAWYQDHSQEHLNTAQKLFEDAVQKLPTSADAHHGLAIIADLQQRYPDAEREYRQALAIAPENSQILGDLGYSYLLQNRLPEAEQVLNQSLAFDRNNANATKHLGDVYARQGKRQLAESMYSRVLNESDMARALAENAAEVQGENIELASKSTEQEKDQSLLSRLRPKKETEADLTAEIRRQMDEAKLADMQRRQQSPPGQQSNPSPAGAPGSSGYPWAGQPQPSQGGYGQTADPRFEGQRLQRELAQIERESYARVPQGPIVIDNPRTGAATQVPGVNAAPQNWQAPDSNDQPWSGQGTPVTQGVYPAAQPYAPQQQDAQSQLENSGRNPSQGQPEWAAEIVSMSPQQGPMNRPQVQRSDPVMRPWGQVAQAAGPNLPQTVDQAHYQNTVSQSPAFQGPNGTAMQTSSSPFFSEPTRNPDGSPVQRPGTASPGNDELQAYEEAARAAARLGMGLGAVKTSGNLAPVTSRSSAGTNSAWNGNYYGTPQRVLPSDAPPQDLNQAYRPQASENMAPPPGSHGQFPSSTPPLRTSDQFGTASRYQPEGYQNSYNTQVPAAPNLQQYEDQRQRADADLNGAMQGAWDRPADRLVTPAAGQVNASSSSPSGSTTPPPWPYRPANMNPYETAPSTTQQPPAGSNSQGSQNLQYDEGVVVPRSYPGSANRGSNSSGSQNYSPPVWASQSTQTSGYRGSSTTPTVSPQTGYPAQGANMPQIISTR